MSLKLINLVWDRFPAGGSKLVIMQALADIGNDQGSNIWPGADFLAVKARMSPRQTDRVVKELAAEGWIKKIDEQIPGRKIRPDRYLLNVQKLSDCPPLLYKKGGHSASENQTSSAGKVDTKIPESALPSQSAVEPFNRINREPRPDTIDGKILNQRRFITQLETGPDYETRDDEIATAKKRLDELIAERDHNQQPLFGEN